MQTREQIRAQTAFLCVEKQQSHGNSPGIEESKYRTFALSFPALIHGSGLAQAVSFAEAKEFTVYQANLKRVMNLPDNTDIGDYIRTADHEDYIFASRNALECAGWLKRYSEALLHSQESETEQTQQDEDQAMAPNPEGGHD